MELDWFKSYIQDLKQRCKVYGHTLKIGDANCDVPQGSFLDPILLLTSLRDLPCALQSTKVCQLINQSINQLINQSINQSINK